MTLMIRGEIEKDGVEYAIVADDNFNYNDPYYRAMFEPPSFLWTPGGSPILVGGSVSAKKVAVGGKLGIIQDPFGKNGTPKFLGVTLPLDGYGIRNLSVSEDGKVLLGQLYGGYGTDNPNVQKEHQTHVWNVGAIIDAALAMTDKEREIHHIKFTDQQNDTINNEQRVDAGAGVPIGTYFDPEPVVVKVEGNLGDVIEVDLKRMIAHELLGLPKPGPKLTDAEKALINQKNAQIQEIIDNIDNFNFVANEKTKLTDVSKKDERAFTLVTNDKLEPISQDKNGKDATFKDEGRLFMAANLMQKATEKKSGNHTGDTVVERLRKGENIKGGMSESFLITYQLKKDVDPGNGKAKIAKGSGTANVTVTANDFAKAKDTIFFGDRDLKNPGYSAFKLSGDVKVGSTNTLDVYRVEQRLQYLGYGVAAAAVNGAGEVTVDGKLDSKEEVDLRMFRQIVAGKTEYDAKEGSKPAVTEKTGKKTVVKVPEVPPTPVEVKKGSDLENWLNAFNAPHWMKFTGFSGDAKPDQLNGWVNKTTGENKTLGTSWVYDLMVAGQYAAKVQGRTPLWFKGAGSLGAQLDLGINEKYISSAIQNKLYDEEFLIGLSAADSYDLKNVVAKNTSDATPQERLKYLLQERNRIKQTGVGTWDTQRATQLADLLKYVNKVNPAVNNPNNQAEALKDFLTVYSATQNDTVANNGSLDEQLQLIKSGGTDKKEIQKLLFGDGTQANGLIKRDGLLIGSKADKGDLDTSFDARSLAAILNSTEAMVTPWVETINKALASGDINTPKLLAVFLANVAQETGGLRTTAQTGNFTDPLKRGRGILQLTNRDTYENATFGNYVKPDGILDEWKPSLNEWLGLQKDSIAHPRGMNPETDKQAFVTRNQTTGQLTVTGKTEPNWWVRATFEPNPKLSKGKATEYVKADSAGNYTITSKDAYPALRDVQLRAVQYNFLEKEGYEQLETGKNLMLAAKSGVWYWRFAKKNDLNLKSLSKNMDGLYQESIDKINKREATAAPKPAKDRRDHYVHAKSVVEAGNTYGNMRALLGDIGLKAVNQGDYNNRFGITLMKRDAKRIGEAGSLLLAEQSSFAMSSGREALSAALKADFNIQAGDIDMLFMDLPNTEPFSLNNMENVAAATTPALHGTRYGVCEFQEKGKQIPLFYSQYMEDFLPKKFLDGVSGPSGDGLDRLGEWRMGIKVKVIRNPDHGKMVSEDGGDPWYAPNPNFVGKDRVEVLVSGKDLKGNAISRTLVYFINVLPKKEYTRLLAEKTDYYAFVKHYCGSRKITWPIVDEPGVPAKGETNTDGYFNWFNLGGSSDLNIVLANASSAITGWGDLSGSAVGQTTGTGSTAQITLDSNAAGHGWFIDNTPDQNDEFLPTSNPDVWIAKAGSAADGKMDMLSVLLHEYGHALGIEHSGDDGDFMAASLQPGERRLPSPDELSLMARLVAALKQTSADPTASSLPVSNVSLMSWYRLRRAEYGWVLDTDQTQLVSRVDLAASLGAANAKPAAQKETAVNNTLSQNSKDWQTLGDVRSNNATITLGESNQANAHLTQSFAVKQGDRYLSFTVANNGMQSNGVDEDGSESGPDDAFEVALLNANTGASVVGTDGLTLSDAILNIQSDGTEHKASSVRKVHNADGSDTYFVDLQQAVNNGNGLVTGTPVSLSFDLMGFGVQNSHVSLRDIKLVQDPVAFDDAVTSNEDATASIDVLSNDLLGGGVANSAAQLNIISQPAHGSISINADGTISYVPAAHFYGNDSFSYTTTVDGRVSNQATVTLHVSHVNHAPVVTSDNVAMTVTAGKPVAFNLLVLSQHYGYLRKFLSKSTSGLRRC